MNILYHRPAWVDYLLLVAGTGIMAVALQCIYDPVGLVTGGFTGAAIIVKEVTMPLVDGGVPLWVTNFILNVPLFIFAYLTKGSRFIGRTVVATFLLSGWLAVLPVINLVEGDYVISALFGGVLMGAGIGMVLVARGTTGGTDMLAVLIQHKLKQFSVVKIMMVIDALIVVAGAFIFGIRPALYAIVSIFCSTKMSDLIMEGMKYSKAVFIISNSSEEIASRILAELDRGVTGIQATGMYSGENKQMLYCVVSKKEIVDLKELVMNVDKEAFVIVTDAREVLGEGFLEY